MIVKLKKLVINLDEFRVKSNIDKNLSSYTELSRSAFINDDPM